MYASKLIMPGTPEWDNFVNYCENISLLYDDSKLKKLKLIAACIEMQLSKSGTIKQLENRIVQHAKLCITPKLKDLLYNIQVIGLVEHEYWVYCCNDSNFSWKNLHCILSSLGLQKYGSQDVMTTLQSLNNKHANNWEIMAAQLLNGQYTGDWHFMMARILINIHLLINMNDENWNHFAKEIKYPGPKIAFINKIILTVQRNINITSSTEDSYENISDDKVDNNLTLYEKRKIRNKIKLAKKMGTEKSKIVFANKIILDAQNIYKENKNTAELNIISNQYNKLENELCLLKDDLCLLKTSLSTKKCEVVVQILPKLPPLPIIECFICYESLTNMAFCTLNCQHKICLVCYNKLPKNNECPYCRSSIH